MSTIQIQSTWWQSPVLISVKIYSSWIFYPSIKWLVYSTVPPVMRLSKSDTKYPSDDTYTQSCMHVKHESLTLRVIRDFGKLQKPVKVPQCYLWPSINVPYWHWGQPPSRDTHLATACWCLLSPCLWSDGLKQRTSTIEQFRLSIKCCIAHTAEWNSSLVMVYWKLTNKCWDKLFQVYIIHPVNHICLTPLRKRNLQTITRFCSLTSKERYILFTKNLWGVLMICMFHQCKHFVQVKVCIWKRCSLYGKI